MNRLNYEELYFTGRGVSALFALLKSIQPNKRTILIPVNICEIVYPIVKKAKFKIIFYDVDSKTGNTSLELIKKSYTGREKVLLAVHNYGRPIHIDSIMRWAKQEDVFVIEDVCNALGAKYNGKDLGTWGDASIFSFGYAKIIEHGVGGAFRITDDIVKKRAVDIASRFESYTSIHEERNAFFQSELRELRLKKEANAVEYNSIYEEYSDYLLYSIEKYEEKKIKEKLETLSENLKRRKRIADIYRKEIKTKSVEVLPEINGQIYWRYNMLVNKQSRDALVRYLRNNDILASSWYPPIAEFFDANKQNTDFPSSVKFAQKVVNLFVDERVSEDKAYRTAELINNFSEW